MSKADEFYYSWADTHVFYKYAIELEAENEKYRSGLHDATLEVLQLNNLLESTDAHCAKLEAENEELKTTIINLRGVKDVPPTDIAAAAIYRLL